MAETFGKTIRAARLASRWPVLEDFAYRVGCAATAYKEYELGRALPERGALDRICKRSFFSQALCKELAFLWDKEKAAQLGIAIDVRTRMSAEELAAKLQREAAYVLKQAQILLPNSTRTVMERRFIMILRDVLGE